MRVILLTHSHLRHQRGEADNHTTDGDELINVLRVEEAHVLGLFCVVCPDLNLVLQLCIGVQRCEHLIGSHVQDGDHLLWVPHQLPVQLWAKPLQVGAVQGQDGLF